MTSKETGVRVAIGAAFLHPATATEVYGGGIRHYDYHEVHRQRAARVVVVIAVPRATDTANRITSTAGRDIRHSHNATVTAISVPLCAVDSSGDHHLSPKDTDKPSAVDRITLSWTKLSDQ